MRRTILHTLFALPMVAMVFSSCSTESMEADVVSGERMLVGATYDVGGDASTDNSIPVEANCGWRVTSDVDWITIKKPEAGLGNGSGNVVFDVAASMLSTAQTGHLTITTDGGMPRVITVRQRPGNIVLQANQSSLFYSYEGGNQSLQVTCNSSFTITSSVDWLKIDDESTLTVEGDKIFTVHAEGNDNPDSRTALITLTDIEHKAGVLTIPVEVGGKNPMLTVTAVPDVQAGGGLVSFGVETNFQWKATITNLQPAGTGSWATFADGAMQQVGAPAAVPVPVEINVQPNTSHSERIITIVVETQSNIGVNKSQTVTLRQNGAIMPVAYTPYAQNITMTEATLVFNAVTSSMPIEQCGIIYSTSDANVTAGTRIVGTSEGENATTTLTNLQAGTTYYAVGFVTTAVGTAYSEVMSFKTRLTPGRENNPTP